MSKEEIDSIYLKYKDTVSSMCMDIRSLDFGILIEQYLQQLIFCLFAIPILIKNNLILNSNNEPITLSYFAEQMKTSNDIRKDFFQLFNALRKGPTKKEFTINNSKLQIIAHQKYASLTSEISYKEISKLISNWKDFLHFYFEVLEMFDDKLIESYSTIYERSLDQLVNEVKDDVENKSKIDNLLTERRKKGVYYTPPEVTLFMNNKTLIHFLNNITNVEINNISDLQENISEDSLIKIQKELLEIKILDPACGSGDFLINYAHLLFETHIIVNQRLGRKVSLFETKKMIIENNIFGVDLQQDSISFTKTRLFLWCIDGLANASEISNISFNLETGNSLIGWGNDEIGKTIEFADLDQEFLQKINKHHEKNPISIDKLKSMKPLHWSKQFVEVFSTGGFDVIVGNPPYIEIKKFRDKVEKQVFSSTYSSAYKLYDISILFLERGIELLKENGFFSFILTNKFATNDYGEPIRKLLLTKTKLQSIIDVSYISVFKEAATYPLIITFQKNSLKPFTSNLENIFEIFPKLEKLSDLTNLKESTNITQQAFFNLPRHRFELTGNINYVNEIRNAGPTSLGDLGKFSYRLLGFTDWIKVLDNLTLTKTLTDDLKFIGTTNVFRFAINHKKPLTVAKKRIIANYLSLQVSYEKGWSIFTKPKLIVKEVAKFLTVTYDPGLYANATGMYLFAPDDSINPKVLLLILNSKLMDNYYSSLYSGTHLAGGYLRYNGSYLKELPIAYPIEEEIVKTFEKLADYILFLSQIQYSSEAFYKTKHSEIKTICSYFESYADELVEYLYLKTDNLLDTTNKSNKHFREISFDNWLRKINELDENEASQLTLEIYQEIKSSYLELLGK
ncbi:MAG: Eco57I restriction-modification methylase domain-containing protein [Candidatus Heimdallarchaeota archaeon]